MVFFLLHTLKTWPGSVTSSVRVWNAWLNQLTVWPFPFGSTVFPLTCSVWFFPAKKLEKSSPMTFRSFPDCGTIRPFRWVGVVASAARNKGPLEVKAKWGEMEDKENAREFFLRRCLRPTVTPWKNELKLTVPSSIPTALYIYHT